MAPNPTCTSDTVDVSGCSDPVPRLLYATVSDVSGCSEFDDKVVQILYDDASASWKSDDDDLVIEFNQDGFSSSLLSYCVGDRTPFPATIFSSCSTPIDLTFSNNPLECCGTVDIHIGETP